MTNHHENTLAERPPRKPRIDAQRNHERVLEAAKIVFSAGGPEASLEAVARQAGVGIGTLYRHFPTREALFEAVYRREVQQLADLAEHLMQQPDPVEALRRWMHAIVEFVATKKGMLATLAVATHSKTAMTALSSERLTQMVGRLLNRAVQAGKVRADIGPEDLLLTLVGLCTIQSAPGWKTNVLRLVDVFVDGMKRPASASF